MYSVQEQEIHWSMKDEKVVGVWTNDTNQSIIYEDTIRIRAVQQKKPFDENINNFFCTFNLGVIMFISSSTKSCVLTNTSRLHV